MQIVGRLHPGIDTLVFSPKQFCLPPLPEYQLMVVAKGASVPWDGHQYLVPALRELGRKYRHMRVIWLGRLEPPYLGCPVEHWQTHEEDQVALLYSRATVFVLPSLREGAPRTVREAMACGTAVVTTPPGVDWGKHEENLLFVPVADSKAIVAAVSRLFDDPRLRQVLVLEALRTAREYPWSRYLKEFDAILEEQLAWSSTSAVAAESTLAASG